MEKQMKVYKIAVHIDIKKHKEFDRWLDKVYLMTKSEGLVLSDELVSIIIYETKRTKMLNLCCMLKNNGYRILSIEEEE